MRILIYSVVLYCMSFAEAEFRNCSYPQKVLDQQDLNINYCKNNDKVCEIQYDTPKLTATTKFTATKDTTASDLKCEATFSFRQVSQNDPSRSFKLDCYIGGKDEIDSSRINVPIDPIPKGETRFIACDCRKSGKFDKGAIGNAVIRISSHGEEIFCYYGKCEMSREQSPGGPA